MHRPATHVFALALAAGLLSGAGLSTAATFTIINLDGAGEGLNDPTPVAPVGGNPGVTIGAQRMFVLQQAASIWGGILPSSVTIRLDARFDPRACTTTSGVLGQAGPNTFHHDFGGAPFGGTWYCQALANRLAGFDLSGVDDITMTFNLSVGGATCLPVGWYYGIDGNEGNQIELLPVVLHEMAHGLGFLTTTDLATGAKLGTPSSFPCIYDLFLLDNSVGLHWDIMSNGQRAASAVNCQNLVWDGPNTFQHAAEVLGPKPVLRVNVPAAIAGDYNVGLADFGPALTPGGVTGDVILANDGVGNPANGCEALLNGAQVSGNIALMDRGGCTFVTKVKNAQDAGAVGVIIADSVAACPADAMGGSDPTITIPSVRITQADGNTLKSQLGHENATLLTDPSKRAGADATNRVMLYTPNPLQTGSSVSHWDTSALPNLLMEPGISTSISSEVDLTRQVMADLGWFEGLLAVGDRARSRDRLGPSVPNPAVAASSISFTLAGDDQVELEVFDLGGRLVNRIVDGHMPRGDHTVRWNGNDLSGRPAAPGVYVYRLKTPGVSLSRHLVLVR